MIAGSLCCTTSNAGDLMASKKTDEVSTLWLDHRNAVAAAVVASHLERWQEERSGLAPPIGAKKQTQVGNRGRRSKKKD